MKALILDIKREEWEQTRGMAFAEVESPELKEEKNPGDASSVLIKPVFTGFCGSDKSLWYRHAFKETVFGSMESEGASYRICGHELLGEIVETGSYASSHYGYRVGDTVSTESHIFCGICHQCKIGEEHVCADQKIIGISTNGCFAELIKLPAKELWKTDTDLIRPEVAAIQEPLGNAVHACSRVDLRGKTVAIFGCGTIGLFSILVSRTMGASTIIGIDPNPENLQRAEALGVDLALQVKRPGNNEERSVQPDSDLVEAIRKASFGEGVDVAMEMSGSNLALNTAITGARSGGDIILFGLSQGDYTLTNFQEIIMQGKTLHSIIGRKVFQTWYIVRNLLMSRGHQMQEKIFEVILNKGKGTVFPFHEFKADAFERAMKDHPKLLLSY